MKIQAKLLLSLFCLAASAALADEAPKAQGNPYLQNTPYQFGFGSAPIKPWTMSPSKTKEEKTRMMRMMMPL
ncbi:MAG: hypothetical protein WCA45_00370, partial [Thiobacillaceae bacterium]